MNTSTAIPGHQPPPGFLREGTLRLNPAQAGWIVREIRYERQRDETRAKSHIADLREMMQRGMWREKDQLDFARLPDGRLILVNGHHRLRAQSESGQDIIWNIAFHDCANMDAVGSLYHTFDTNVRRRSNSNVLAGVGLAADLGISKLTADALYRAVPVIVGGMKVGPHLADGARLIDDRLAACRRLSVEASILEACFKTAPAQMKRKLHGAGVFAVALVTMQADKQRSSEFWTGVAENDGLRKADPRATLIQWLTFNSNQSGLLSAPMIAAAWAWNAFVEGRDIKYIRISGSNNVRIARTQYRVQP